MLSFLYQYINLLYWHGIIILLIPWLSRHRLVVSRNLRRSIETTLASVIVLLCLELHLSHQGIPDGWSIILHEPWTTQIPLLGKRSGFWLGRISWELSFMIALRRLGFPLYHELRVICLHGGVGCRLLLIELLLRLSHVSLLVFRLYHAPFEVR